MKVKKKGTLIIQIKTVAEDVKQNTKATKTHKNIISPSCLIVAAHRQIKSITSKTRGVVGFFGALFKVIPPHNPLK